MLITSLDLLPLYKWRVHKERYILINKYSNIPLYSQLKDLIIKKIKNGEFPERSRIPSEQELCSTYDISRPTVRQAISELTSSGILYKEKGKGTFVAKTRTSIDIKDYSGFADSILDSQDPSRKNIISIRQVVGTEIGKIEFIFGAASALSKNQDFAEIKYLSMQDNEILSLNTSYIPLALFPNIIDDIKAKKPSYDILRGKYPLVPVKTKSCLEIEYTEQSDAQHLRIQPGQPLIRIENILYSKSGQSVEYVISKYRADKSRLLFENSK